MPERTLSLLGVFIGSLVSTLWPDGHDWARFCPSAGWGRPEMLRLREAAQMWSTLDTESSANILDHDVDAPLCAPIRPQSVSLLSLDKVDMDGSTFSAILGVWFSSLCSPPPLVLCDGIGSLPDGTGTQTSWIGLKLALEMVLADSLEGSEGASGLVQS